MNTLVLILILLDTLLHVVRYYQDASYKWALTLAFFAGVLTISLLWITNHA